MVIIVLRTGHQRNLTRCHQFTLHENSQGQEARLVPAKGKPEALVPAVPRAGLLSKFRDDSLDLVCVFSSREQPQICFQRLNGFCGLTLFRIKRGKISADKKREARPSIGVCGVGVYERRALPSYLDYC